MENYRVKLFHLNKDELFLTNIFANGGIIPKSNYTKYIQLGCINSWTHVVINDAITSGKVAQFKYIFDISAYLPLHVQADAACQPRYEAKKGIRPRRRSIEDRRGDVKIANVTIFLDIQRVASPACKASSQSNNPSSFRELNKTLSFLLSHFPKRNSSRCKKSLSNLTTNIRWVAYW